MVFWPILHMTLRIPNDLDLQSSRSFQKSICHTWKPIYRAITHCSMLICCWDMTFYGNLGNLRNCWLVAMATRLQPLSYAISKDIPPKHKLQMVAYMKIIVTICPENGTKNSNFGVWPTDYVCACLYVCVSHTGPWIAKKGKCAFKTRLYTAWIVSPGWRFRLYLSRLMGTLPRKLGGLRGC